MCICLFLSIILYGIAMVSETRVEEVIEYEEFTGEVWIEETLFIPAHHHEWLLLDVGATVWVMNDTLLCKVTVDPIRVESGYLKFEVNGCVWVFIWHRTYQDVSKEPHVKLTDMPPIIKINNLSNETAKVEIRGICIITYLKRIYEIRETKYKPYAYSWLPATISLTMAIAYSIILLITTLIQYEKTKKPKPTSNLK